MSASPSVAVVVPVHDGARYLAETLASVGTQTLPPHEVLVVDDGSRDDSAAIAERAGVRVLRQANAGPGAARNRAVAATTCDLVAFLDADDLFLPDKLERQVRLLRAAPDALGVCGDALLAGGPRDGTTRNGGCGVPARLHFDDLLQRNPIVTSSVLVRRAAIEHAGGFDEDRVLIATEDYDLWLRMLAVTGSHFLYVDAPLVCYRVHDGGLSASGRFVGGLDRIAEKVALLRPGDARVAAAMRRRRAEARLDAAWENLRAGQRAPARALLAEARGLVGLSLAHAKLWLRSWI